MSKIKWDQTGERLYETGVNQGVLYPLSNEGVYTPGVAWNGLTAVTESPSGAEATPLYADNIKYLNLISAEEFGATIEAYTYPDEFAICDGSAALATGVIAGQQRRKTFGLSFKTLLGNDVDNDSYGYKIHLIYGCLASPSERAYATVNDSPEAITFSWEITTTPVNISGEGLEGFKPTACLTIDSTKVDSTKLAQLEEILYGRNASAAVYTATTDVTPQTGKTYYTKDGDTYTEFTGSEFVEGTTYYELTTPATEELIPRLPLPDEVATIFAEG